MHIVEILVFGAFYFIYGVITGSFLNVCIYRIPQKENIVSKRSHCMACGNVLKWYELIPLVSFLLQGGKCRKCRIKLSWQYPLVELCNGLIWVWTYFIYGFTLESILYCLCASVLIVISMIDLKTFEIPPGCNLFLLVLGIARMAADLAHWQDYVIGFFAVSGFFFVLYLLTKGRGMGGGDIKLMAAAGLLLGWQKIILAMILGCVLGSVIHLILMKVQKKERLLAFGPYLAAGIELAVLYGEKMIHWYLSCMLGSGI